ncbi:transposase [Escherichia coli O146:H21 str. 2010C-3325]|nr:transposase [Escherichia coli O146:H21 str. 2010C-3325]KDV63735.1 transposase [Escherichia coli O128:H2 str. 2011C-3317]
MMPDGTFYCHKHARQLTCLLLFFLVKFYPSWLYLLLL